MNKLLTISATTLLTGVFLFCVFAGVAALDELARLPFYYTLPIAGLLVNSARLLLLFHKRGRIEIVSRSFARLISTTATFFRRCFGSGTNQQVISRSSCVLQVDYASEPQPLAEEIEAALRKIYSVVWGFPSGNQFVTRAMRGEEISDKALQ